MGLDMYGYARKGGEESNVELAYWRKHNALHNWMETRFLERGGSGTFNCVPLQLTTEDLDRLEADVKGRNLEPTVGFFFGSPEYSEEDWAETEKQDLAFVEKAREHLAQGYAVYYNSWW